MATAKADEDIKTSEKAEARRNAFAPGNIKVPVKVIAEDGISYSGPEEPDGIAEKGKIVFLPQAVAAVLGQEGSVAPLTENDLS